MIREHICGETAANCHFFCGIKCPMCKILLDFLDFDFIFIISVFFKAENLIKSLVSNPAGIGLSLSEYLHLNGAKKR